MILDFPSLVSVDTLRDALAWAKRKYNEDCASCIERELSKRSANPVEVQRCENDDETTILFKLAELRREQHQLASKLEHHKTRSELDFQTTLRELSKKRERFLELDQMRTELKESLEESREQFEQARMMYEAAMAHFEGEERALQCTEADLQQVMQDLHVLQGRRDELEGTLKRFSDTEKNLTAPIHVECVRIVLDNGKADTVNNNKLECPVCRDEEISASFQCGHSFCRVCVDKMYVIRRDSSLSASSISSASTVMTNASCYAGISIKCPMCKTPVKSVHPLFL